MNKQSKNASYVLPLLRPRRGGSMRLGGYPCILETGTHAHRIYGKTEIRERHRHRYEFNPEYRDRLSRAGMVFSGTSPDGRLVEIIEIEDHPFFVASQFHPEGRRTRAWQR